MIKCQDRRVEVEHVVRSIAESLIASARNDAAGVYWELGIKARLPGDTAACNLALHSGVTGVLLFLAEYHHTYGDERVPPLVKKALTWCEFMQRKARRRQGFYSGYAGFLYSKAHILNLIDAEPAALAVEEVAETVARADTRDYSIGHGHAGDLLAVLGLRKFHPEHEAALGEIAEGSLRTLINATSFDRGGVYWSHYPIAVSPPLGFLHGTSGIRHLLAGLGRDTVWSKRLLASTRQYEDSRFSDEQRCWPDSMLDLMRHNPRQLKRFASCRVQEPFRASWGIEGWANGLAGIMAAEPVASVGEQRHEIHRRAFSLLREKWTQAKPGGMNFTLQNGWGGVALSLLRMAHGNADEAAAEFAAEIAEAAVRQRGEHGYFAGASSAPLANNGLFEGLPGIGYFLLRCGQGGASGATSILFPDVEEAGFAGRISDLEADRMVLKRASVLAAQGWQESSGLLPENLDCDALKKHLTAVGAAFAPAEKLEICIDVARLSFASRGQNAAYIAERRKHRKRLFAARLEKASPRAILRLDLQLAEGTELGKCALPEDPGKFALILFDHTCHGVVRYNPTPPAFAILSQFRKSNSGRRIIPQLCAKYDRYRRAKAAEIETEVANCLRAFLSVGVLECAPSLLNRVQGWALSLPHRRQ